MSDEVTPVVEEEETPAEGAMPAAEGEVVEGEAKKDGEETETEAPAM